MGIGPFRSSSCSCWSHRGSSTTPVVEITKTSKFGNPDPKNFRITRTYEHSSGWTVIEANYPDSKNYEGNKIMVFKCNAVTLQAVKMLDPHFCEKGHLSPFARFEPTEDGWLAALQLVSILGKK